MEKMMTLKNQLIDQSVFSEKFLARRVDQLMKKEYVF